VKLDGNHQTEATKRRPGFTIASLFGLALLLCLSTGCFRGGNYELVPVEGVVTINGEPAENIMVQFMPNALEETEGPTSEAITGPDGKFVLKTVDQREGAVVGRHVVVLFDMEEDRPAQGEPLEHEPRISSRYNTAAGGIKVEVKPGEPVNINIEE